MKIYSLRIYKTLFRLWLQQRHERAPVHRWFSLSYCSYVVWPRSVMQSMPLEWQKKFVKLAEEIDGECFKYGIGTPDYQVLSKSNGKFVTDPYKNYRHSGNVFSVAEQVLAAQKE